MTTDQHIIQIVALYQKQMEYSDRFWGLLLTVALALSSYYETGAREFAQTSIKEKFFLGTSGMVRKAALQQAQNVCDAVLPLWCGDNAHTELLFPRGRYEWP